MRVFITVLLLIFSLQSWIKADDISDFEIEGMSIGDSLLDYFSEDEIKNNIVKTYYKYKSTKKFVAVEFYEVPFFKTYKDGIQIHLKRNDKKYEIYSIRAFFYIDDKSTCLKKREEIVKDIKSLFNDVFFQEGDIKHYLYKDSMQYIAQFSFQPGKKYTDHIRVECFIAGKKSKKEVASGLNLVSSTSEIEKWLDSL